MSTDKGPPKTGYKHPPVEHQYKKGQTGNGKGRPPKAGRAYSSSLSRPLRSFSPDMVA